MKTRILLMVASLALSVAIGLALSRNGGKTGEPTKADRIRIGFSMDTLKEARWQRDRDVFIAKAEAMGAEVLVQSANSNDTKQMQDIEGLISRGVDVLVIVPHDGTDFDAILASNDGTAGGAIQALSEEGLAGKIAVTGQDADLPALQRIVAGTQAMTIYKPIRFLAEEAAKVAVKMAQRKPVIARSGVDNGSKEVPSILVDVSTVTKENIRETVVKDGFHPEAEIYRNAPADAR